MASKNPSVNVPFKQFNYKELTPEALEMREDLFLSKIAKKLDKENTKTYSHEEVWK